MPGTQTVEGLLGKGMVTGEGLHLYHADKDPVIVHTAADAEKYKDLGYQEDYIHREYPKFDAASGRTFKSAEEEDAAPAQPKVKKSKEVTA